MSVRFWLLCFRTMGPYRNQRTEQWSFKGTLADFQSLDPLATSNQYFIVITNQKNRCEMGRLQWNYMTVTSQLRPMLSKKRKYREIYTRKCLWQAFIVQLRVSTWTDRQSTAKLTSLTLLVCSPISMDTNGSSRCTLCGRSKCHDMWIPNTWTETHMCCLLHPLPICRLRRSERRCGSWLCHRQSPRPSTFSWVKTQVGHGLESSLEAGGEEVERQELEVNKCVFRIIC